MQGEDSEEASEKKADASKHPHFDIVSSTSPVKGKASAVVVPLPAQAQPPAPSPADQIRPSKTGMDSAASKYPVVSLNHGHGSGWMQGSLQTAASSQAGEVQNVEVMYPKIGPSSGAV